MDGILAGMILVAIFIHGIAFYLMQSLATSPRLSPESTPRLTLLDPRRSADREFLQWIDANDPAAIALESIPASPPEELLTLRYRPSFQKNLPVPLPVKLREAESGRALFFPPGPVPDPQEVAADVVVVHPMPKTQVRLSPQLDAEFPEPFVPPRVTGESPGPTRFLIVTAPENTFVFLGQSSGNLALDSAARAWLARGKFPSERVTGWVDIHWGADVWEKSSP